MPLSFDKQKKKSCAESFPIFQEAKNRPPYKQGLLYPRCLKHSPRLLDILTAHISLTHFQKDYHVYPYHFPGSAWAATYPQGSSDSSINIYYLYVPSISIAICWTSWWHHCSGWCPSESLILYNKNRFIETSANKDGIYLFKTLILSHLYFKSISIFQYVLIIVH